MTDYPKTMADPYGLGPCFLPERVPGPKLKPLLVFDFTRNADGIQADHTEYLDELGMTPADYREWTHG